MQCASCKAPSNHPGHQLSEELGDCGLHCMPTFIASALPAKNGKPDCRTHGATKFRNIHMQQELALKHDFVRRTNRGTYATYLNMGWSEQTSFRPVAAHLTTVAATLNTCRTRQVESHKLSTCPRRTRPCNKTFLGILGSTLKSLSGKHGDRKHGSVLFRRTNMAHMALGHPNNAFEFAAVAKIPHCQTGVLASCGWAESCTFWGWQTLGDGISCSATCMSCMSDVSNTLMDTTNHTSPKINE
ncbi:unnamed protein product [Durusdinium trenchii]|uniref:Uncharacterized protein n=1 Tax=Durusdinium trenchii TaxID=1381693 RepID=A0ABP0MC10_9DINO